MKTLIIILALGSVCFAQNSYFIESDWAEDYMILLSVDSARKVTINQNFTAINTLALLDEYFEECYNDSSLWKGWKWKTIEEYENGKVGGYNTYVTEWIHREPTLKGFQKFLKKKIEGKEEEKEKKKGRIK